MRTAVGLRFGLSIIAAAAGLVAPGLDGPRTAIAADVTRELGPLPGVWSENSAEFGALAYFIDRAYPDGTQGLLPAAPVPGDLLRRRALMESLARSAASVRARPGAVNVAGGVLFARTTPDGSRQVGWAFVPNTAPVPAGQPLILSHGQSLALPRVSDRWFANRVASGGYAYDNSLIEIRSAFNVGRMPDGRTAMLDLSPGLSMRIASIASTAPHEEEASGCGTYFRDGTLTYLRLSPGANDTDFIPPGRCHPGIVLTAPSWLRAAAPAPAPAPAACGCTCTPQPGKAFLPNPYSGGSYPVSLSCTGRVARGSFQGQLQAVVLIPVSRFATPVPADFRLMVTGTSSPDLAEGAAFIDALARFQASETLPDGSTRTRLQTDTADGSASQQESVTRDAAGAIVGSGSASLSRSDPALLSVRANFARISSGFALSTLNCQANAAIPIPASSATCGCCTGAPAAVPATLPAAVPQAGPAMQSVPPRAALTLMQSAPSGVGFGPLAATPPGDGFDAGAFDQKLVFVRGACRAGAAPMMNPIVGLRGALRTKGIPGSASRAPVSFPVADPWTAAVSSLPTDEPLRDPQWGPLYVEATRLLSASAASDVRVEFRESRSASGSLLKARLSAATAKARGLRYQEASVRVQGSQLVVTVRAAKEGAVDGLECTMAAAVASTVGDPRP